MKRGQMEKDIQDEINAEAQISCARCGKNIWDADDSQYDEIGVICHACWHVLNPGAFCLACAEGHEL
jgi:hypothetical protein